MKKSYNNLDYSEEALNVKSFFYNKKVMIYVEGEDDVIFWDEKFKEINTDYKLESVGGLLKLKEYISLICNGNKKIIVACDRDHSIYLDETSYLNPQIVTSYGYSIENTMFCPQNIATQIRRLSRSTTDFTFDVQKWYNEFCDSASKLLPYDIGNHIYKKGIACYGDNCCKFLKPQGSGIHLDDDVIDSFISSISKSYDKQEIKEIVNKIEKDKRKIRYKIKGHFITNAAANFIKKKVKDASSINPNISKEMLYSIFSNCISVCDPICKDKEFLKEQIIRAFSSIA